jgi:acyl carrier protein
MSLNPTDAAIREFLVHELLYDKGLSELSADESLLEEGLLDSLGILRTVAFCEEQFGVSIPDAEVLPENLESVRAIAALVERCRSGK